MADHILVIDEGTSSTRAIIYDRAFQQVALAQSAITLTYPSDGWVEQDGQEIWTKTREVCRAVLAEIEGVGGVAAIGITNQRETTLIWDRKTGVPIAPAIVWQDRRTARACDALIADGHHEAIQASTGLVVDAYFSATKIAWLLDNIDGARARADAGELAFGTIDTFLIWHLTAGQVHATDVTNASRTMVYNIGEDGVGRWDANLLKLLNIPESLLPDVRPSNGDFGRTDAAIFGAEIPIRSAIGDQQAALFGQGCLAPGQAKITLGTGAFLLANTGQTRPVSTQRLLSTAAYELQGVGAGAYALEGAIFNAGTVVQWMRDELGLLDNASQSEALARSVDDTAGAYLVPAFTGLGAPHWDADARGTLTGITRATNRAHVVRAGLEAVAYQTCDLLDAFRRDGAGVDRLCIDGGMAGNDWLMQFMADVSGVPVWRPNAAEMTALGAAALAAIAVGWLSADVWSNREHPGKLFTPQISADQQSLLRRGWAAALGRTVTA